MGFSETIGSIRQDVARTIEASSTAEVSQILGKLQLMMQTIPIQHRILKQLIYRDYKRAARRSQIHDAGRDTCGWILEYGDNKAGDHNLDWQHRVKTSKAFHRWLRAGDHNSDWQHRVETSKAFRRWLREGQNIQHISGNPGAGKSTLVGISKFFCCFN
jgi:hypothetical protein